MKIRNKKREKPKITFIYKSLNPFHSSNNAYNLDNSRSRPEAGEENEWLIEYESIYRSYQLDR
jgi:hypothetical protein